LLVIDKHNERAERVKKISS